MAPHQTTAPTPASSHNAASAASKIEMPGFMNRGPDALESLAAASPATSTLSTPTPTRRTAPRIASRTSPSAFSVLQRPREREGSAPRGENGRRNALYDQVQRLELDLETEVRRRQESDRLLREKVEADLRAMEENTRRRRDARDTDGTESLVRRPLRLLR